VDQCTDTAGTERRRALFEEALSLIERTYEDDRLTVSDLSQKIFTSRRQLQRAFAEAGTSVQEKLHATRMRRSAELLDDSSLTIAQIARSVGYRQPPQFAKAFRRYYRLTPSQWRTAARSTPREAISMVGQPGLQAPTETLPRPVPPRPARDEHERDLERRLRELDRRFHELEPAA